MTERDDQTTPQPSPEMNSALMRGMTQRRMSRRNMIKYAGMSVGGLSLASILAACGGDGSNAGSGTATAGDKVDFGAAPGDNIKFANWPLYIDTALNEDTADVPPSLDEVHRGHRHQRRLRGGDQRQRLVLRRAAARCCRPARTPAGTSSSSRTAASSPRSPRTGG